MAAPTAEACKAKRQLGGLAQRQLAGRSHGHTTPAHAATVPAHAVSGQNCPSIRPNDKLLPCWGTQSIHIAAVWPAQRQRQRQGQGQRRLGYLGQHVGAPGLAPQGNSLVLLAEGACVHVELVPPLADVAQPGLIPRVYLWANTVLTHVPLSDTLELILQGMLYSVGGIASPVPTHVRVSSWHLGPWQRHRSSCPHQHSSIHCCDIHLTANIWLMNN